MYIKKLQNIIMQIANIFCDFCYILLFHSDFIEIVKKMCFIIYIGAYTILLYVTKGEML